MRYEEIKTLAAELATLGSTTLARKATVLMIGFPELDKKNIHMYIATHNKK